MHDSRLFGLVFTGSYAHGDTAGAEKKVQTPTANGSCDYGTLPYCLGHHYCAPMDCVDEKRPDNNPDPEQLEGMLRVCRTCWLLTAQFRAIFATIEQEPKCLGDPTTMALLGRCRDGLDKHHRETSHIPINELAQALFTAAERRQKKPQGK